MQRRGTFPLALFAAAFVCGGCVEHFVDLRVPEDPADGSSKEPIDGSCGLRQRVNPVTGWCEPCDYAEGHPEVVCPCDYEYLPQPFPWCAAEAAYYECLPCRGDINACGAFTASAGGDALGTSVNCGRLLDCCAELDGAPESTACCQPGFTLRCDLDGRDDLTATVSCEAQGSSCCRGWLCSGGDSDCASWQSCSAGRCDPPCAPDTEACCADCGCTCEQL